jgi:hypothetical protein
MCCAPVISSVNAAFQACSARAGYITGQNILIDGGACPGTF